VTVQHHHAHAAAVLWEHGECDATAVALAWDGTGYGDDGVSWGGECLLASMNEYRSIALLRTFLLPGGDAAAREPWRVALSLATQCEIPADVLRGLWPDVAETTLQQIARLAANPRLSTRSTSMGRLFDAVAALALPASAAQYEGQLAMRLESVCDPQAPGAYAIDWYPDESLFDWRPMWREALQDKLNDVAPGAIAMRFHRAVANLAARVSDHYADFPLVTCGGVFQNAVLGELLAERIQDRPSRWLRPHHAPPGDGGLALGQLAVAWARLRTSSTS
jgi:hydrogenase maturation protein HypF